MKFEKYSAEEYDVMMSRKFGTLQLPRFAAIASCRAQNYTSMELMQDNE
jgi:hypothetical protein